MLRRHNFNIETLPSLPDCPDSHFVEDTAVLFRDPAGGGEEVAVVCSNMAGPRRPEVPTMVAALEAQPDPFDRLEYLDGDGEMLDGGDVLKCPVSSRVYVGLSSRSSEAGVQKVRGFLY